MNDSTFVFFDAVGTLIRPEPAPAEVYGAVAARFGLTLSPDEVASRFRAAFKRQETLDRASGDWRTSPEREVERWRTIVSETLHELPDAEPAFQELWEHFSLPSAWAVYDDAADIVRRLDAAGRPWGVASNFDARLRRVVAGLPTLRACQTIVTSAEVGYRKPGSGFFQAAALAASRSPAQLLLVGDDDENDRLGATNAGWRALLVDRRAGETIDFARLG